MTVGGTSTSVLSSSVTASLEPPSSCADGAEPLTPGGEEATQSSLARVLGGELGGALTVLSQDVDGGVAGDIVVLREFGSQPGTLFSTCPVCGQAMRKFLERVFTFWLGGVNVNSGLADCVEEPNVNFWVA
jgi:hypothetical protein